VGSTRRSYRSRIANACRRAGVATTTPDCLIAAQAIGRGARLFTTDQDFNLMARHSELRLFQVDE